MKGIKIEVVKGPVAKENFVFQETPVRVGRKIGELKLADPKVSGLHAEISWDGEIAVIYDKDSLNGLFINGRLVKEAILHERDRLLLGDTECEVTFLYEDQRRGDLLAMIEERRRQFENFSFAIGSQEQKIEELILNELK